MEIVYETNGKGFLGWLVEYPGAFVRGRTQGEASAKVQAELLAWSSWLDLPLPRDAETSSGLRRSELMIEDADTDILLDYDVRDYGSPEEFERDLSLVLVSARKVNDLFLGCGHKDIADPAMDRETFYGKVHGTIRRQYEHIVGVQLYYLRKLGTEADIGFDIIRGRKRTMEALRAQHETGGNRIISDGEESWTIRKAIRRLVWHDRIHARAMERMRIRLG